MPSNRSLFKAQKLADRCNREREQIEALETRLYELRQKHTRTHAAMYEALPEGFFVSLSPTEPWEIVGPARETV